MEDTLIESSNWAYRTNHKRTGTAQQYDVSVMVCVDAGVDRWVRWAAQAE